jgi:hypothetical protein
MLAVALSAVLGSAAPAHATDRGPEVVAGLRETLRLSIERALAGIGRPDGFVANPAVRVQLPEQLMRAESMLRVAGHDRVVERFSESLSRVAEHAVSAARPVLLNGAAEVPLEDGYRVLTGGDTAATDALRRHVTGRVIAALSPAVADAMDHMGATRRYKRFMKDAQFGGLVQAPNLDLDAYVVGRSVEAIFQSIGQEERRIRVDPAARTTPLLRRVFGR